MWNRIAAFAVAAAICALFWTMPARAQGVAVDGDTMRRNGVTYRLMGYDAPETYAPRCKAEKLLGQQATKRLQAMLHTPHVELRTGGQKDKYGRTLAVATYAGEPIAGTMIEDGLAVPYNCPDFRCPARINWCQQK